jgi:hypothetical protein
VVRSLLEADVLPHCGKRCIAMRVNHNGQFLSTGFVDRIDKSDIQHHYVCREVALTVYGKNLIFSGRNYVGERRSIRPTGP